MDAKKNVERIAQAPVDEAFTDRRSPCSFNPEPLGELQIQTLFEACCLAPSCFNGQPHG